MKRSWIVESQRDDDRNVLPFIYWLPRGCVSRETFGGCGGWEWFHVKHLPPIFMVGYGVGFYCDD